MPEAGVQSPRDGTESKISDPPSRNEFNALPHADKKRLVGSLSEERRRAVERYRDVVEWLRMSALATEEDAALYQQAVSQLAVDELTLYDVVMIARNLRLPLHHGDSFFRKMVERRRMKQLGPVPEKYLGYSKNVDLEFARTLGVPVPETLWTGSLAELPDELMRGTFLKPSRSSGSKGAFYLFEEDDIFSAFSSERLNGRQALMEACREQMGASGVEAVSWEVQELVQEADKQPARDMKFYAFYGEIGLIDEAARFPRKQYAFFDGDGRIADCGRGEPPFLDPRDTITDKGGLPAERLEVVRNFSLSIPAPFMRIDFLNGKEELVFCELSSSPGKSHTFNREYDRILGEMYTRAQLRLSNDLLAGKRFDSYSTWVGKLGELIKRR